MNSPGSVYIFKRFEDHWIQEQKLEGIGGFGYSVALSDNYAIVGAHYESLSGEKIHGAAYIFERGEYSWLQVQKLTNNVKYSEFGASVDIFEDYAIVGSPYDEPSGGAYIFKRQESSPSGLGIWEQMGEKLTGTVQAQDTDLFGISVAISGSYIIVGDPKGENEQGVTSGTAYIFKLDGDNWMQEIMLTNNNGKHFDFFGRAVAISNQHAFIGAPRVDRDGKIDSGAAYLVSLNNWHTEELSVTEPIMRDSFGFSLALSDNFMFVGTDAGTHSGSAYVFEFEKLPLVFIPGAAGSELTENDEKLWLPPKWLWPPNKGGEKQIMRLSLFPYDNPSEDIVATDVIRYPLSPSTLFSIYGKLLDHLTNEAEYIPYDFHKHLEQGRCDLQQQSDDPEQNPNLFIFPYDWRKNVNELAQRLDEYIQCVREFHPGKKVNILTHSMGSLVARRYIINSSSDPNDIEEYHYVEKLITSGAPWLGAPKILNVANTGDLNIVGLNKEATNTTLRL